MSRAKGGSSFVGDPACIAVMQWKKYKDGTITYHIPVNIRLLASKVEWPEVIGPTEKISVRVEREGAAAIPRSRNRQGTLCYATTRRLQMKLGTEIQDSQDLIGPLLEEQKELEMFLNNYDQEKSMKRELRRKCLHEDVWGTVRSRLDHHMAVCNPLEVRARQDLYRQYLRHGNIKGDVFLDNCDLGVYDPYLLRGMKPHNCELRGDELKKRASKRKSKTRCQAGCRYKWTRQSDDDDDGVAPVIHPLDVEPADWGRVKCSRTCLDVPYFLRKYATRDGTCHHQGCGFSRPGPAPAPNGGRRLARRGSGQLNWRQLVRGR
ncbi:uncharacterized protein LOC144064964 [Stigmatopora argus]